MLSFGPPSPSTILSTSTLKIDKMKYFKVRRRRVGRSKITSTLSGAIVNTLMTESTGNGEVGADYYSSREHYSEDLQEQTNEQCIQEPNETEKERDICKDRLLCARRRKDIRLTRKEVSCLQLLVQTVLSEHLVLSRELQAANERMGLPVELVESRDNISPLARNVERLQSALERDSSRLKAALRDRDERLEGAAANAAALKLELEKWRNESAEEAELQRQALNLALAERDRSCEASAEKDQVISNLRSKLANLNLKKSNEALTMSRALTEKEIIIEKLQSQVRDNAAELMMLQEDYNKMEALLELERTARYSTDNNLETLRSDLKRAQEDNEGTVLMLSQVLSDKEEEQDDLKRQMEDAKREFEDEVAEVKRRAEDGIADVKRTLERAVSLKTTELHDVQCIFKTTQSEVQRLRSELERERNRNAILHGELAAARSDLANTRETASANLQQVSRVEAELDEERSRHEVEMREREAAFEERMQDRKAAYEKQMKRLTAEAELVEVDHEKRVSQLQEKALAEKSNLDQQISTLEKRLKKAENIAARLPAVESNLKAANEEIRFLNEKATERNAELATKKKEAQLNLEEAKRTKVEMELMMRRKEEEMAKLREELEAVKVKREEDASHFRQALHEKDVEIREGQDRIEQIERDQEAVQKSLSSMQKTLDDTTQKHKASMANAKSTYRETLALYKRQVAEKTEEIKSLQETVKTLHGKISELHRQHNQDVDKLKSNWERSKNALEKKIKEKEALLKDCEAKRTSLSTDLSKTVESRDMILKELELVREELKRTVEVLYEAKAETRLALDTMVESEGAMTSIYAESVQRKMALTETQLKIDEIEKKWLEARKQVEEREKIYTKLKVRFVKFVKFQDDELKAAGDSAEQNRAEAQRYLDELQSSRTELAHTEDRCQTLKSELKLALNKINCLCGSEHALLEQSEQNKQLLAIAEGEVERLKSILGCRSSELIHLKDELAEKESQLEIISADLSRERALSAKHSAECQDAFALIESVSRERGFSLDPEVKLPDGVEMLLQNIRRLEIELLESYQQFSIVELENNALKKELSSKTSELITQDSLLLATKDECGQKMQLDLTELLQEISTQRDKITDLEKCIEDIINQAKAAMEAQETLKAELVEGKYFLRDANSKIERLCSQLEHERSRVTELQSELSNATEMKNEYERELNVRSLSIQDLSESLCRLEGELQLKEVLWKTLAERTGEAECLKGRLDEQEREVSRLLSLLEQAHEECNCKAHYESADGDGRKETHSDGLKELKNTLTERDTDVAKLRSVIVDLQGELSVNKSTSDEQIASYRFQVEELSNVITALRRQLEEQESEMRNSSEQARLDLHWTAEQTRLSGRQDASRVSPRRRPGAPGGAPLKRTVSEGNGEWDKDQGDLIPAVQMPQLEGDASEFSPVLQEPQREEDLVDLAPVLQVQLEKNPSEFIPALQVPQWKENPSDFAPVLQKPEWEKDHNELSPVVQISVSGCPDSPP